MSTDLRTELNSCDAITGFTGDGSVSVDNTTGFVYQGTNSISTQHSNTDEHVYTTSIGGTIDLSDATVYMILKDNLVQTAANGGVQIVLQSGTNRPGYGVGGNDDPGMPLDVFWNSYKLDVTERANAPYSNNYQGTAASYAPASTNAVGLGTVHLAKAQGNVDNIKLDRFSYHLNGNYAIRINGGTVGTPETMVDVVGDSVTNGWGLFANPIGSQFTFHGPTEFGEPAANADVYFEAIDEQWTLVGGAVGATHFPFRFVANATDTISFTFDTVSITGTGTRAEWDMSDTNIDTLTLKDVTFTDIGAITMLPNTATRDLQNVIFNNCDRVYLDTVSASGITFNGTTDANGAILLDTTAQTALQTGFVFNSDGTGHAIEITASGSTFAFNSFAFNGYGADGTTDAAIFNNSGGLVTINVSGGGTVPTVLNSAGSSTTINVSNTITLTGLENNTEVRLYEGTLATASTATELDGIENSLGDVVLTHSAAGQNAYITIVDLETEIEYIIFTPLPASDLEIPVNQRTDRTYENP